MTTASRKWLTAFAVALVLSAFSESVVAQPAPMTASDPRLKVNVFEYEYVLPKNPAHMKFYEYVKQARLLERFAEFFSPVRLPNRITLKFEDCGHINAYFDKDKILICYEYLDYVHNYARKARPSGQTLRDVLVGPIVEVFMHELGHAIVQLNDIPFFARQEDVADYISTMIMLSFAKDDARRLILGASVIGGAQALEDQRKAPELQLIADTHSLPAVRFFNRLCMAYGFDSKLFADVVGPHALPESRAKYCRYEFLTNEYAFKKLISPYIDQEMAKKVLSQRWFRWEATSHNEGSENVDQRRQ